MHLTDADLDALTVARDACRDGRAKQTRLRANLTQEELALHCGVAASAISRWEDDSRTPRGLPALRYARWLVRRLEEQPS